MTPNLPEVFEPIMRPLFDALPLNDAMDQLVVERRDQRADDLAKQVQSILDAPEIRGRAALAAGLWLYIDDLDRSHAASQSLETPTGAFWHAMMHRREGDFSNSRYWYRRAGRHPAMNHIDIGGGSAGSGTTIGSYDPIHFTEQVERCVREYPDNCHELVSMQRHEWLALFEWCLEQ